ncbi:MAG: pirin family protein [Pseudomonadota bacterium]
MQKQLQSIIQGHATSDGAGVRIKRSLGQSQRARFDPFLMLDEFGSTSATDYIGGFPSHPHRGFETVTYMLEGHMLHEDHMGNKGHLKNGDVQWMTTARGIIHSEMPQQEEGVMRGFQLWLNLPAAEKMKPAAYKDIPSSAIPVANLSNGGCIKVIANTALINGKKVVGPIQGLTTDPIYWDVHLPLKAAFAHAIPATHNTFIYVYEGEVGIGDPDHEQRKLAAGNAGLLGAGDEINVVALAPDTRFILVAGIPLKEPIAQHGPFVMNTQEEIEQAIDDYRNGVLTH